MVSADVQIFKCVTHERWKTNFVHLHTIHTVEQTYIHISWGALNMQDLKMLDIDMNLADHRRHTGHKIAAHENTGKKDGNSYQVVGGINSYGGVYLLPQSSSKLVPVYGLDTVCY